MKISQECALRCTAVVSFDSREMRVLLSKAPKVKTGLIAKPQRIHGRCHVAPGVGLDFRWRNRPKLLAFLRFKNRRNVCTKALADLELVVIRVMMHGGHGQPGLRCHMRDAMPAV